MAENGHFLRAKNTDIIYLHIYNIHQYQYKPSHALLVGLKFWASCGPEIETTFFSYSMFMTYQTHVNRDPFLTFFFNYHFLSKMFLISFFELTYTYNHLLGSNNRFT